MAVNKLNKKVCPACQLTWQGPVWAAGPTVVANGLRKRIQKWMMEERFFIEQRVSSDVSVSKNTWCQSSFQMMLLGEDHELMTAIQGTSVLKGIDLEGNVLRQQYFRAKTWDVDVLPHAGQRVVRGLRGSIFLRMKVMKAMQTG